jgi:GAF domain-containing protein
MAHVIDSDVGDELAQVRRELSEAVAQQTAAAEVLKTISRSAFDLRSVLDALADSAVRLCEAYDCAVWRRRGDELELVAHTGPIEVGPVRLVRETVTGRSTLEGRTIHIADLQAEREQFPEGSAVAQRRGFHTIVHVPLMREGAAIGGLALRRKEKQPFTNRQIALLETFADQAVIAIENARLFEAEQQRTRELTESLEQQTATSEVLRVISSSPRDIQPVLEAILQTAGRLCASEYALFFKVQDGKSWLVASNNAHAEYVKYLSEHPIPVDRGSLTGRTVIERRTVHIPDCLSDSEYNKQDYAHIGKHRTMLGVPLVRDGIVIGLISLLRTSPEPYTDKQIELVTTFADQAVIAIENVRLFDAEQARTRELSEALEYQTATGEVLNIISRSPTNVQPVFDMIAESAWRLCHAQFCFVYQFDGQLLHFIAHHGLPQELVEMNRRNYPTPPSRKHVAPRAILARDVVQIPDVLADPEYELGGLRPQGATAVLRLFPSCAREFPSGLSESRAPSRGCCPANRSSS